MGRGIWLSASIMALAQSCLFCPCCGVPMKTSDAHVRCDTCHEYLDEFIYVLVELHPHLKR